MNRKEYLQNYYQNHKEDFMNRSKESKAKMKKHIKESLGNKCIICGSKDNLIFHHLKYDTKSGKPSYKAYKLGNLVLVCTHHHASLNNLSKLRLKGELDKILDLLNKESIYGVEE